MVEQVRFLASAMDERNVERSGYLFIVGLGRTGTTLTRNILNCSDAIGLAGEAKFFSSAPYWFILHNIGHRQLFSKIGDISTETGARKVVDFLYDRTRRKSNFWDFSKQNFDHQEFLNGFLATDRTERALLDLTMGYYAKGKPIRGEKTPANLYDVPTLKEWFPIAKIIHTFRDPRAIYVSRRKKKERWTLPRLNQIIRKSGFIFELYAGFRIVMDWQQAIGLHHQYEEAYPDSYYLSKYEDLIRDPQSALRNLCNFLEIDFMEEMLQPTFTNSSVVPRDRFQGGFDTSAIDRWRKHIHPLINRWITLCCKKELLELGYSL